VKLQKNENDVKMLQKINGKGTMIRTQVFMSVKQFQDRREDVKSKSKSGHEITSRTNPNL
jgi:hypothetical protein